MSYSIVFTPEAESDIGRHKKSGDKKTLTRIEKLLNELREHPFKGTGKPEQLKHYKTAGREELQANTGSFTGFSKKK